MQDKNTLTEAYCENCTAQKGTGSTECKTNECRTEVRWNKRKHTHTDTHTHTHTHNKNEYKKGWRLISARQKWQGKNFSAGSCWLMSLKVCLACNEK